MPDERCTDMHNSYLNNYRISFLQIVKQKRMMIKSILNVIYATASQKPPVNLDES